MWSSNISMFFIVMNTTQIEMFGKLIFNLIPLFMLIAVTSISLNKQNLIYFISGCLGIIFFFKNDIWASDIWIYGNTFGFSYFNNNGVFFRIKK